MTSSHEAQSIFLRRLRITALAVGGTAGLLIPPLAALFIGAAAWDWLFFLACLVLGLALGSLHALGVKLALRRQLRQHLDLLRPSGSTRRRQSQDLDELQATLGATAAELRGFVSELARASDTFAPHYRTLDDISAALAQRTETGLAAARSARGKIEAVEEKQHQIAAQMELLAGSTEQEVALTHELSASLEEMSEAVERSNSRFIETSATVDEMAMSLRQVASESDGVARSVEQTVRDLGGISESMARIRHEAEAGAGAVAGVKSDAETGLRVVTTSIGEMAEIAGESRKAMAAMERLAQRADEVGKIIRVIRELVSDTELLAFNAAIIAAQAGAEGRGFSVVAEEIRDLADRTTTSAQDIERIVQAITSDTEEATRTVEATGARIAQGNRQSESAGSALRQIVASAEQAVAATNEIVRVTETQSQRSAALVTGAGDNLRAMHSVARAIQEQQLAINRIQLGVTDMKEASDHISRGMEEQLRAKRTLDRGLEERMAQIAAVNGAVQFQLGIAREVFAHLAASEERLAGNAERAAAIRRELVALATLTGQLQTLTERCAAPRE